jgi:hypothetical protein
MSPLKKPGELWSFGFFVVAQLPGFPIFPYFMHFSPDLSLEKPIDFTDKIM